MNTKESKELTKEMKDIYTVIKYKYYWKPEHKKLFQKTYPELKKEKREAILSLDEKKWKEFQNFRIECLKLFNKENNLKSLFD